METSPFEGLEGATGGSDYDSTSYGNRRTYTHSSGSAEVSLGLSRSGSFVLNNA